MIYQETGAALNPVVRLGEQLSEVPLRAHKQFSLERLRETTPFLLAQVGFTREACVGTAYPHQLSGRQQQRLATALAIACNPSLVVADEPTTAPDPVTQLEILSLWKGLQRKFRPPLQRSSALDEARWWLFTLVLVLIPIFLLFYWLADTLQPRFPAFDPAI